MVVLAKAPAMAPAHKLVITISVLLSLLVVEFWLFKCEVAMFGRQEITSSLLQSALKNV